MSPPPASGADSPRRFPRVSGDEPLEDIKADYSFEFSPRERG